MTDYMCQEKEEEEDLPVLKTAFTHRHNDDIGKRGGRLITTTRSNNDNARTNRTDRDETINHIVIECGKLSQKEYKRIDTTGWAK